MGVELEPEVGSDADSTRRGQREHWWKNPTHGFSFLLVVGTFLLAIVTAGLFWATRDLAVDGQKALIANTRAWVGPFEASIDGFTSQSKVANILIKYKNPGKEPALNFNDSYNDDWTGTLSNDLRPDQPVDLAKNCWADGPTGTVTRETCEARIARWLKDYCSEKAPYENRVIYPEVPYEVAKPFKVTPDRIGIKKIGFLQGCFIYRSGVTRDQDHRSAFCYFDRFIPSGQSRKLRSCSVGNQAN